MTNPLPESSFSALVAAIEQFESDVRAAFADLFKWLIARLVSGGK